MKSVLKILLMCGGLCQMGLLLSVSSCKSFLASDYNRKKPRSVAIAPRVCLLGDGTRTATGKREFSIDLFRDLQVTAAIELSRKGNRVTNRAICRYLCVSSRALEMGHKEVVFLSKEALVLRENILRAKAHELSKDPEPEPICFEVEFN